MQYSGSTRRTIKASQEWSQLVQGGNKAAGGWWLHFLFLHIIWSKFVGRTWILDYETPTAWVEAYRVLGLSQWFWKGGWKSSCFASMKKIVFWNALEYACRLLGVSTGAGEIFFCVSELVPLGLSWFLHGINASFDLIFRLHGFNKSRSLLRQRNLQVSRLAAIQV